MGAGAEGHAVLNAKARERWGGWLLGAVSALLVGATVLPLAASNAWWIRVFDFPRIQIAAALVLMLALTLAFRPRRRFFLTAALAASLAYQVARIYPYLPLVPREVVSVANCPPGQSLSVMTANVLQTNRDYSPLIELVGARDPDILVLLETDAKWAAALAPLRRDFGVVIGAPLDNTYGLMVFSRRPLLGTELRFLVERDIPSLRAGVELGSGAIVDLYAVHPRPPLPGKDTAQRDAELVLVGREAKARGRPAIVAGDLNDVAWSDTTRLFQRVSGMLDPRIGRGFYPTFPADIPLLRWPLDHVFFTEEMGLLEFERLPAIGSDHFPVFARVCYRPTAMSAAQDAPAPEAGDRRKARKAITEGIAEEREELRTGEDETQTPE